MLFIQDFREFCAYLMANIEELDIRQREMGLRLTYGLSNKVGCTESGPRRAAKLLRILYASFF